MMVNSNVRLFAGIFIAALCGVTALESSAVYSWQDQQRQNEYASNLSGRLSRATQGLPLELRLIADSVPQIRDLRYTAQFDTSKSPQEKQRASNELARIKQAFLNNVEQRIRESENRARMGTGGRLLHPLQQLRNALISANVDNILSAEHAIAQQIGY